MRERVLRVGVSAVAFALGCLTTANVEGMVPVAPVVLVLLPLPAPAPARLFAGSSTCPRADAVYAQLGTLIPPDRLARRLAAPSHEPLLVQLVDLGARYRVIAAGNRREYRDEGRDCAYRARVAAVFVALTLDPAAAPSAAPPPGIPPAPAAPVPVEPRAVATKPPPTPAPPAAPHAAADKDGSAPAAPRAVSPEASLPQAPQSPSPVLDGEVRSGVGTTVAADNPRRPSAISLHLAAALQIGLGTSDRVTAPGFELRLVMGGGDWSLMAGAVLTAPVETVVGGLRMREWRVPAEVGVRRRFAGHRWTPFAEAGLGLSFVNGRALDLASNENETAVELGLHGGVGIRFASRARVAPFGGIQLEYVPGPSAVSESPRGVIGHTSNMWLGAAFGASIDL